MQRRPGAGGVRPCPGLDPGQDRGLPRGQPCRGKDRLPDGMDRCGAGPFGRQVALAQARGRIGPAASHSPRRGQVHVRPGRRQGEARLDPGDRARLFRRCRRRGGGLPGQPERILPLPCGPPESLRQRAGHDASSREGLRSLAGAAVASRQVGGRQAECHPRRAALEAGPREDFLREPRGVLGGAG